MRLLNRLIWACLIAGITTTPILAQAGGSPGGSSGGISGGSPGGSSGGMSGGSAGGTSLQSTTLSTLGSTPTITAPSNTSGAQSSVSSSNFFGPYYANPYYQGVLSNSSSNNNNPGGFGTVLFSGTGSSSGGGQIGYAGTSGSTTSTSTAGRVGSKSSTGSSTTSAVVIGAPYAISAPFRTAFPVAAVPHSQLQSEILGMLARTRDVSVRDLQVLTDGKNVTVKGFVNSEEDAKAVRRMINMTPGTGGVINEIKFPVVKQP